MCPNNLEGKRLRRHRRLDSFILAQINAGETGEAITDGTVSNISESGCLLMTAVTLTIGQEITVLFDLPEDGGRIEAKGVVRNIRKSQYEDVHNYGIEFLNIEPDMSKKLRFLVQTNSDFPIEL